MTEHHSRIVQDKKMCGSGSITLEEDSELHGLGWTRGFTWVLVTGTGTGMEISIRRKTRTVATGTGSATLNSNSENDTYYILKVATLLRSLPRLKFTTSSKSTYYYYIY